MSSAIAMGSLAVVAGATVVGGAIASNGAQKAAQTQANALQAGQAVTQQEFNTITQQEQPFIQGGYGALNQLNYLMGIPGQQPQVSMSGPTYGETAGGNMIGGGGNRPGNGPGYQTGWSPGGGLQIMPSGAGTQVAAQQSGAQAAAGQQPPAGQSVPGGYGSLNAPFTADMMKQYSPAYQFQLQQGGQGVLNQSSANGGAESGSAMKDLISYNQNLANTSFNNAFNQYQTQQGNTYNRLMGLTSLGQNAAANLGSQGTALSGNQASLMASQGASMAAGQVATANAISSGVTGMIPWLVKSPN